MEKKTNVQWKIKVHYGSVLAPPKENWDGIRAGMFEAAGVCMTYTPGKVPLHTVPLLPAGHSQFHLMGKKPVKTVKDLEGLRVRAGGEIANVL
jgi:TRAP-type mannitol/chloroaromatic compound transport system substrate-binding protein